MMRLRRTKIIAPIGPANSSPEVIEQMILAGMDVAHLNFSHSTPDEHRARAELFRATAARLGRHVAHLGDQQGPKIRIPRFADKPTQASCCLLRGVYPVPFDPSRFLVERVGEAAVADLVRRSAVLAGYWNVPTQGDSYNNAGGTNNIKLLQAGHANS